MDMLVHECERQRLTRCDVQPRTTSVCHIGAGTVLLVTDGHHPQFVSSAQTTLVSITKVFEGLALNAFYLDWPVVLWYVLFAQIVALVIR